MSGPGRRFDPSELLGASGPEPTSAELAEALAAARALEAHASDDRIRPTAGFEDRVMAAIATEPAPRFMVGTAFAGRGGRAAALLATVRDAWVIATSGGRPLAVRAQALGFVLFVVVAAGSLTGVAAVGVGSFLTAQPSPDPSLEALPVPTVDPSLVGPSPSPSASSSASPSPTVDVSPSPSSSPVPTETLEPTSTPSATQTVSPTDTANPTETPEPTDTANPTETPEPTDTANPTETPEPTETPGAPR